MALESLLYEKYSFATDYWSYGVTLWEMFTLYDPHVDKAVTPYEEIKDNKEVENYFTRHYFTHVNILHNNILHITFYKSHHIFTKQFLLQFLTQCVVNVLCKISNVLVI